MRFSFRKKDDGPRWVDSAALGWTPDEPLDFEPRFKGAPTWQYESEPAEPRAATPEPALRLAKPVPQPQAEAPPPAPELPPQPANNNKAPNVLLQRLGIGLGQGLALYLLLQSHALNFWPGSNPELFAALFLALLFAPTVAQEGLGEIENRLLALWSGTVAFTLATLGLYQQWRMQGAPEHSGVTLIVLAAVTLMVAQVLLRAALREGKLLAGYRSYFDTAWTLAVRLLIWAALTGIAFALIGSGNSLLNWLRSHHPAVPLIVAPSLLILLLLGLVSAAAFDMTAQGSWTRRQVMDALLACCTMALPMLIVVSVAALAIGFVRAPLSLAAAVALAGLLLIAFNASYRGDDNRTRWRKTSEGIAAFLVVALAGVAAVALHLRVIELGWTAERMLAAAAIAMLTLYGLAYGGAALIGLGGGLWMKPIERANLVLALVTIAACLALSTPLADPLRLAVAAQAARAEHNPDTFDFAWLQRDGGRFGHDALLAMTQGHNPAIARQAALALSAPAETEPPAPTEIGANITVRTPGARLPNSLLDQDWSDAPVPPCLTLPAQACDAWFLDLDGDGVNEILLVHGSEARWWAAVMKLEQGKWAPAGTLASPPCQGSLAAMRAGGVTLADPLPRWRDVLVAGLRLSPMPAPKADLPCPGL